MRKRVAADANMAQGRGAARNARIQASFFSAGTLPGFQGSELPLDCAMIFKPALHPAGLPEWVALDGVGGTYSGVGSMALLTTQTAVYMFGVSPFQAAIVAVGPILILLLAIITSYNYHRRRSILWAPPAMFAVAMAISLGAGSFVVSTHYGLVLVMLASAALILHQVAIRIHVALEKQQKLPSIHQTLTVATGAGPYRWSER